MEEAERVRLPECAQLFEDAIEAGYEAPAHKVDECEHGRFAWEDCINCYDAALMQVVAGLRARAARAATLDPSQP